MAGSKDFFNWLGLPRVLWACAIVVMGSTAASLSSVFMAHSLNLMRHESGETLRVLLKVLHVGLLISAIFTGIVMLVDLRKTRRVDTRKLVLIIGLFLIASCASFSEELLDSLGSGYGLAGVLTNGNLYRVYWAWVYEGVILGRIFSALGSYWAIRQGIGCLGLCITFIWSLRLTKGIRGRSRISELRFLIAQPMALFSLCGAHFFMFPAAFQFQFLPSNPPLWNLRFIFLVAAAVLPFVMCIVILRDKGGRASRLMGVSAGLFCLFWGISITIYSSIVWDSFLGLTDMSHPVIYFRFLATAPLILQGFSLIVMFLVLTLGVSGSRPDGTPTVLTNAYRTESTVS